MSPSKPRLLVLTSTFPRWRDDPEPPFVFELSRRLTDRFEIAVLAPRTPGSLEHEVMDDLRVVRFPYFFRRRETLASQGGGILNRLRANPLNYLLVPFLLLGQTRALIRLLRREDWALIHAHWLIPQGAVALLARVLARRPVPLVCTSHGGDLFALRSAPLRALKRAVLRASARSTVVSAAMRAEVLTLGVDPARVEVIPMGVDLRERFVPDPALPRDPELLLFVGRLVAKKGVDVLLRALPAVLARRPSLRLILAGGGPLEASLRRLAETLGVARQVEFRGMVRQDELPALYRRATLFVAPFRVADGGDQEGFPLVPLEAIGCGCPLICGRIVAFGEIIRHDREALLVPAEDPPALADAILTLLADPARRDRLAEQARARCLEAFDWSTIAARYRALLEEALTASNAPPTSAPCTHPSRLSQLAAASARASPAGERTQGTEV